MEEKFPQFNELNEFELAKIKGGLCPDDGGNDDPPAGGGTGGQD